MLRVAAMLAAALLATIDVACYSKPDAPQLDDAHGALDDGKRLDAARLDASGIDATPPCTTTLIAGFAGNNDPGCSSGLSVLAPQALNTSISYNGTLNITVPADTGATAGCRTNSSYSLTAGLAVDLVNPPLVPNASAQFRVYAQTQTSSSPIQITILKTDLGTNATVLCPGGGTDTAPLTDAPPYRLIIKGNGAATEAVTVTVSTGAGSTAVKTCTLTGSAGSGSAELVAGGGTGSDDTIGFDNLESCP